MILERLRNNPKIQYDSVTGRYRFKPTYPIRTKDEVLAFIQSRPSLLVDGDLLECYKTVNDDVTDLLISKKVRAIRQADFDRTLKCDIAQPTVTKQIKCSLYSDSRCANCSTNRGVVLMKRFEPEIESIQVEPELKEFWDSVKFPHISEIHRITQSQSQHLLTTNTSQLISNKAVRKVRGAARKTDRFSWSDVNANRVSNIHIMGLLEQSSEKQ